MVPVLSDIFLDLLVYGKVLKVTAMFPKFLSILILWSNFHTSLQFEYVLTIIEEFKLKNPYLIGSLTDISRELLKLLYISGHFVTSHTHIDEMSLSKNITTHFRNERFMLDEIVWQNTSKFTIFLEKENPIRFFRFSFRA